MGKEQKSGSWIKSKLYYIGRTNFSVKLKMRRKRQLNIFSTLKQTILCPIKVRNHYKIILPWIYKGVANTPTAVDLCNNR